METPTPVSTFVARSQIVLLSCLCACLAAVLVGYAGLSERHITNDYSLSKFFVPLVIALLFLIGKYSTLIVFGKKRDLKFDFWV